MAHVQCGICGGMVDASKQNYAYANGIHQHKKCPKKDTKPVLDEQEKRDYKELTDAIKWAAIKYNKDISWRLITSQIKKYKEMGHSYQDQLYTFKYIIERDNTYWGYGRVENFFGHALEHRRRLQQHDKSKVAEQAIPVVDPAKRKLRVTSNPEFM